MNASSRPSPSAYVAGLGLLGPGLADWTSAAAILGGRARWTPDRTVLVAPDLLPAAERRRSVRVVKLALSIGLEAARAAGVDPRSLATVFSSSGGDGYNCHQLCETLASDDRHISPTRFHNSVHNAAAGYWSIATGATPASTALCAYDASFGAGLLEALAHVAVERAPCLLIAYDADYPEPLHATRPVPDAFGVAMLLTPERPAGAAPRIGVSLCDDPADRLPDPDLETLRRAIPAARALPLLEAIARGAPARVVLDYLDDARLAVELAA